MPLPPAPPPAWYSAIAPDPAVTPRPAEQCGHFVYRYYRSQGRGYPTLGQPYFFLLTGRDERAVPRPAWLRFRNGTTEPPRAGDILVAKGAAPGAFHTALITRVDGQGVHVLQANLAPVHDVYQLVLRRGVFTLPAHAGLGIAGWIRPTGRDALRRS